MGRLITSSISFITLRACPQTFPDKEAPPVIPYPNTKFECMILKRGYMKAILIKDYGNRDQLLIQMPNRASLPLPQIKIPAP
jgi:hypothetical protein